MRKKFLAVMMAAAMAVTMVGCGKADNASADAAKNSTTKSSKQKETTAERTVTTLHDILTEGEYSILYSTSNIDKDATPNIYVMYNDGTYISGAEYSFKELSGMSDEDILSFVEEKWREKKESKAEKASADDLEHELGRAAYELGYESYYYYYKDGDMERLTRNMNYDYEVVIDTLLMYYGDEISSGELDTAEIDYEQFESELGSFWTNWLRENIDEIYAFLIGEQSLELDYSEIASEYLAEAKAACDDTFAEIEDKYKNTSISYDRDKYTVSVWTDSTGNNVEKEAIYFGSDEFNNLSIEIEGYVYPQAILDAYYGGFSSKYALFVIRTSADAVFKVDSIGTEGVNVDEKVDPNETAQSGN